MGAARGEYRQRRQRLAAALGGSGSRSHLCADGLGKPGFFRRGAASQCCSCGDRPGDDRWGNSLLALDADPGKLVWARQLVHHDLWDYDLPAQPPLVTLEHDGKEVPAVIQATKMGMLFTFNRLT